MKRNSSMINYHSAIKKQSSMKATPTLPDKLWNLIFSKLSFDDQLKCRLVCKNWSDLIATLPEFKNKNYLVLGYYALSEDDPPLSTLSNSKLEFTSMKFLPLANLEAFPSLPTFLLRIGESLTYLDISFDTAENDIYNGLPQYKFKILKDILKHLSLFKVLHHLKMFSLVNWLMDIDFRSPDYDFFKQSLLKSLTKADGDWTLESIDSVIVRKNLNPSKWDNRDDLLLVMAKGYRQLLLEKIKNNLDLVNTDKNKAVDLIYEQFDEAIKEVDRSRDLSCLINTSVRILTTQEWYVTDKDAEKLMVLVPNLEKINLEASSSGFNIQKIPSTFIEKLTVLEISKPNKAIDAIENSKFSNVNRLEFINAMEENSSEVVEQFLQLLPQVKSISGYSDNLADISEKHIDFITDLKLVIHRNSLFNSKKLFEFKNLQKLTLYINNIDGVKHFFGHYRMNFNTIKELVFNITDSKCCVACADTFLKSVPNLRKLELNHCLKWNATNTIFMYQKNLEKLEFNDECEPGKGFKPDDQWPDMKHLKSLTIKCYTVGGGKLAWNKFGKKLEKLKYLRVDADDCVNLKDMIGSNMPALQKVVSRSYDSPWKFYTTKFVLRKEGKYEYMVEKYPTDWRNGNMSFKTLYGTLSSETEASEAESNDDDSSDAESNDDDDSIEAESSENDSCDSGM